jgi:hypothetical protein
MPKGRSNKLAGQIGEYLVCAELGRRGLIATPFSGNVPTFDVLATDELCRTVPIQVKTSRSNNWPSDARSWMKIHLNIKTGVQEYLGPVEIQYPDLIYVCVAIAAPGGRDRFFILTRADLQQACIGGYTRWMGERGWKRPRTPGSYDCRYPLSAIEEFENNWDLITERLGRSNPDASLASQADLRDPDEV